jgi:hypothetical protein
MCSPKKHTAPNNKNTNKIKKPPITYFDKNNGDILTYVSIVFVIFLKKSFPGPFRRCGKYV